MPSISVTWSASPRTRRTLMPAERRPPSPGTATSISLPSLLLTSHRAKPDSPSNADPGPHASVAAFHRPCGVTVGRPTAYTPRQSTNSRPVRSRWRIASSV